MWLVYSKIEKINQINHVNSNFKLSLNLFKCIASELKANLNVVNHFDNDFEELHGV